MERLQHHSHDRARPHWLAPTAAAFAVVLLTATLTWLNFEGERSAGPGGRGTPGADSATSPPAASDPTSLQAIIDSAVEECRSAWTAQEAPLKAAATSLTQWQVHVDTMNQLVAGEITLAQAIAFWEQTRIEAAEKITTFTAADLEYAASDPTCETPLMADDPGVDVGVLSACEDTIEARDEVLDSARVSVQTWHHHVIDMDLLLAGKLSPERALELWRRSWKQGVEELAAYREQLGKTALESCERE